MKNCLIFTLLTISLFGFSISSEWLELIDCHFIGNSTKSAHLICDNQLTNTFTKDDCHYSLFQADSKHENKVKLETLSANGCVFADLSTDFSDSFRNLRELDISSASVDNFIYFPLWEFDRLEKWNLSKNALVHIPDGYFESAPHLIEIDLSYNKIWGIDSLGFKGVNRLISIDLSHNHIANLNKGTFSTLIELNKLDLSYNQLKKISSNAFPINKDVDLLWIRKNETDHFRYLTIQSPKDSIAVRVYGNDQRID